MTDTPEISTILYATDVGKQTRPVLRHALAMAKQYNAKVIILHVVEPMSEVAMVAISSYLSREVTKDAQKETMREILVTMKSRLKDFFQEESVSEDEINLVKEFLVVSGKPSEEILRVAEEDQANIIIMGKSTRKVRGIRVMGSTARRVSRMSRVPVLVVPNY